MSLIYVRIALFSYMLMLQIVTNSGVMPATDFLKGSGIGMTDRGFITVDQVGE